MVERESRAGDWTCKQLCSMSQFWSSTVFYSILRIENGEDLHLPHMKIEELNLHVSSNSAVSLLAYLLLV